MANRNNAHSLVFAGSYLLRLRGLFRHPRETGVLMIMPCKAIHTFGMQSPIDVAFFDARGKVVKVARGLPP